MTDAILPLRDSSLPLAMMQPEEAPAAVADSAAVTLIYIAGYGRSGTTLLDIALGEHPAVMGAGEVTALVRHVWDNGEYCACGRPVRDCPSWRAIVGRWLADEPAGFLADYRRAQRRTEGLVGLGRLFPSGGESDHARRTVKLLRGMAAVSGRPILVDSSKLPGRAFALAAMPGIDLHVVHVVRDGRGVAWSLAKGYRRSLRDGLQRELRPKPLLHTALRWSLVNLAAERLCRHVGPARSLRIRYEDFVEDPRGTVGRILAMVGQPPLAGEGMAFRPQHQVAGSRHRMQRAITVHRDDKWKREMSAVRQWLFTLLCAPMLRRYGYPIRGYPIRSGAGEGRPS